MVLKENWDFGYDKSTAELCVSDTTWITTWMGFT